MTTTLKVTEAGEITLPQEVLRHLGVAPGEKIEVALLPDGRVRLRAASAAGSIEDFIGCLYRPGAKPPTIDEMNEIIADAWAGIRKD
jgi:antitoxin PrlF